jgi:hypothetical protein
MLRESVCFRRRMLSVPNDRLVVLAIAIATSSCADFAGLGDYRVSEERGFQFAGECGTCVEAHCGPETATCRDDARCAPFGACLAACRTDGACAYRCYVQHAKVPSSGAMVGCMAQNCLPICDGVGAFWGEGCADCFETNAKDELAGCVADDACSSYLGCTTRTCQAWETDPACRVGCFNETPDAGARLSSLVGAAGVCGTECGWGTHWECINRFSIATQSESLSKIRVLNGLQPEVDAVIQACSADHNCDAAMPTDAAGETTIQPRSYLRVQKPEKCADQLLYLDAPWPKRFSFSSYPLEYTCDAPPARYDAVTGALDVYLMDCVGSTDRVSAASPTISWTITPAVASILPHPNIATWASADHVPPGHYELTARVPNGENVVTSFDVMPGAYTAVMINFPAWIVY